MENFGYALSDASKAIEADPKYLKAYYRRAAAYMALGKYKLALKDYERVHKARPNDADAKKKYTECKKIHQQAAFAKAISVEENKGMSTVSKATIAGIIFSKKVFLVENFRKTK